MLAKVHRLSNDKPIQQAFRTKHRAQTKHTRLLLNRSNQPEFQLLIVVSKKIFKKANKRNRLRRKISAVFEDLLAKNRLPPYTTCVVQVIKKDLLLAKPDEIQTEIIPEISKLYLQMTQAKQKNPTKNQPS